MIISRTRIDAELWKIRMELAKELGFDESGRKMYPLTWYVNTGRASIGFLRDLFSADKKRIVNALKSSGCEDEAIRKIKKIIHFCEI